MQRQKPDSQARLCGSPSRVQRAGAGAGLQGWVLVVVAAKLLGGKGWRRGAQQLTGATCCFMDRVSSAGGGPSMVSEMISSPRSSSMPSTRRSSRCTGRQRRGGGEKE